MDHDKLIDDLGGTGAVASALGRNANAVTMWKARSIPWRWRLPVAKLAEEKGIPLPENFLSPPDEQAA